MKRLLTVGLFALIAIVFVACGGSEPSTSEPAALLEGINDAMASLDSFHIEAKFEVKASQETAVEIVSATIEGDGKPGGDRRSLITMSIKSEAFPFTSRFERREVDGISYSEDPITLEWEIDEEDDTSAYDAIDAAMSGRLRLETVRADVDSLDGLPVYRVTGSVPDDPEVETMVLWVGMDDLLIRRMQAEGHVPSSEYEGVAPPDLDELFQGSLYRFSRFNESVVIVAPEVKPVPPTE